MQLTGHSPLLVITILWLTLSFSRVRSIPKAEFGFHFSSELRALNVRGPLDLHPKKGFWAGEKAQRLRALAVLAEVLSLVASTHIGSQTSSAQGI